MVTRGLTPTPVPQKLGFGASLFEATEIAPGVPFQPGSNAVRDSAAMNGAADVAAKAAMELLERLNKGKTAA